MNQDSAVAKRVIAVMTERLGLSPEDVSASAELAEDLGIDSVDGVELTVALEHEFNVTFPDAILVDVKTVQDVINLVGEHIQAPSEVAPK
jgi:acyl carrier protein